MRFVGCDVRSLASRSACDAGLAGQWSTIQLLGSLLPIRLSMGTPSQLYLLPSSMMAMALMFAAPRSLAGQSARPAAVSLTVVVPARLLLGASLASDERATVLHREGSTLDLEAMIELAD